MSADTSQLNPQDTSLIQENAHDKATTCIAPSLDSAITSGSSSFSAETRSNNSRKRGSEKQITKNDAEDDDDDDEQENENIDIHDEGGRIKQGNFSRASEAVLKTRKILRAKRPHGTATEPTVSVSTTESLQPITTAAVQDANTQDRNNNKLSSSPSNSIPVNPFASIVFSKSSTTSNTTSSEKALFVLSEDKAIRDFISEPSTEAGGKDTHEGGGMTATQMCNTEDKGIHSQEKQKPTIVFGSATAGLSFNTTSITSTTSGMGFGAFASVSCTSTPFAWGSTKTGAFSTPALFSSSTSTVPSLFARAAPGKENTSKDAKKDNEDDHDDNDDNGHEGGDDEEEEVNGDNNFSSSTVSTLFNTAQSTVTNGEDEEDCIFQGRAKLFTQVEETVKEPTESSSQTSSNTLLSSRDPAITPSVPPSSSIPLNPSTHENGDAPVLSHGATHRRWKEVGIGPLRLLETKPMVEKNKQDTVDALKKETQVKPMRRVRIVQRRETTPGGPGTKLILNVPITAVCKVVRLGDKFVQLVALEPKLQEVGTSSDSTQQPSPAPVVVHPVLYLFKVKTVTEADALQEALMAAIQKMTVSSVQ